jgi:hypothetical protein
MFKEPLLAVARPRPFFMRRRFLRSFLPVMFLAVTGLIALLVSGTPLGLPFERLIVLEGLGGSGMEFLEDPRVSEVLLQHHIRAQGEDVGSRAAANVKSPGDFVFVSGQPAADQVSKMHPNSKHTIRLLVRSCWPPSGITPIRSARIGLQNRELSAPPLMDRITTI